MDPSVTGKDTGKDVNKATFINTLGFDEARRRLMDHLHEADRCLTDAIGSKQGTRRFVDSLFGGGAPRRVASAQPEYAVHH